MAGVVGAEEMTILARSEFSEDPPASAFRPVVFAVQVTETILVVKMMR